MESQVAKTNTRYGWVPDIPDHRDYMYAVPSSVLAILPSKVDLRPNCPPVVDQGQLGSCTANAIGNAHRYEQIKQGDARHFLPSRLFIYYNERVMAVGYDDASQRFIVMNSWSNKWGDKGYCHMPYGYLTDTDLAADFWTVRIVEI